jgi:hypothetical protein
MKMTKLHFLELIVKKAGFMRFLGVCDNNVQNPIERCRSITSGVPGGGVFGCSNPPRNSEVLTKLHLIAN